MLAGVVVAILGGAGEPVDDLDVRAGERARPLLDGQLEPLLLALELRVELPGDEQVADPQQRLDAVERLGEEIARPHRQRPLLHRRRVVGGDDQHRQVALDGEQRPQRLHHLEAVEVRHVQVEDDQVGPRDRHLADDLARVGEGGDVAAARGGQQPIEHAHVGRLVVDDEDSRRAQDVADGNHAGGIIAAGSGLSAARPPGARQMRRAPSGGWARSRADRIGSVTGQAMPISGSFHIRPRSAAGS